MIRQCKQLCCIATSTMPFKSLLFYWRRNLLQMSPSIDILIVALCFIFLWFHWNYFCIIFVSILVEYMAPEVITLGVRCKEGRRKVWRRAEGAISPSKPLEGDSIPALFPSQIDEGDCTPCTPESARPGKYTYLFIFVWLIWVYLSETECKAQPYHNLGLVGHFIW